MQKFDLKKKESETRGKNGHVSDSRIRGVCCPLEKTKREKETKMIAHGPSNKQYASKR